MSKISELSDGGSLQSTDYLIAVRSGGNVKVRANGAVSGTTGQFSTSLNVDGTVTADGLTSDGNITLGAGDKLQFNADRYFTPENNIDGAEISANGVFRVKTGATPVARFLVGGTGDISFYEDTGTTPKFFWDASAESLFIGATSASALNTFSDDLIVSNTAAGTGAGISIVSNATNGYSNIHFGDTDDADIGRIQYNNSDNKMTFRTNASDAVVIDSSGQVGIGVTPSAWGASGNTALQIRSSGFLQQDNVTNVGLGRNAVQSGTWSYIANGYAQMLNLEQDGSFKWFQAPSGTAGNTASFTQAMTLDASGNLLVGKTATNYNNDGFQAFAGGFLHATGTQAVANSGTVATLNRKSTDGSIVDFRKDGTLIGDIGNNSNDLAINSQGGLLKFYLAGSRNYTFDTVRIYPETDNARDLGLSSNRFKDLYLSGTAYAGLNIHLQDSGTTRGKIELNASDTDDIDIKAVSLGSNMKFFTVDTERARIDSSGNLLVGETSSNPYSGLTTAHVFKGFSDTAGAAPFGIYNADGAANCPVLNLLNRDTSTDTTNRFLQFYANVTSTTAQAMGGIVGNGANNVQFATLSDAREKTNIQSIGGSLEKINALNPVEFDWIASGEHVNAGFVAQEVEQVFPEFVVENMACEGQEARKGLTGGMTGGIVAHLVKAIQEQQEIINDLRARVAQLEGA